MTLPGYGGRPVVWTDAAPDERIIETLRSILPPSIRTLFDVDFVRSCILYDEYVYRLTLRIARSTGLFEAANHPGTIAELGARAGLAPDREVATGWLVRELASRGVLETVEAPSGSVRRSAESPKVSSPGSESEESPMLSATSDAANPSEWRYRATGPLPDLDPEEPLAVQRTHDPSWMPSYVVAKTSADAYPAFLTGAIPGEEVLFSPERLNLWFDYFSNAHGLYAVNNRLGAIAAEEWMPDRGTILELGGGLGSAAVALLERFRESGRLASLDGYRFTELIPAFLRRGQRALESAFGSWGHVTYGRLDMNKPFEPQGVAAGSVSSVYAVNTVHVAHDLERTLGEIHRALEPGGALVLSECVRPFPDHPIYVELIFNLMEAFRAPKLDPRYRPTGGFLTPEQWTTALESAGFEDVRFLPDMTRVREHFSVFYVAALGARRP